MFSLVQTASIELLILTGDLNLHEAQNRIRLTGLATLQAGGFGDDVGAALGHGCTRWLGAWQDCGGIPRHNNIEERLRRPAGMNASSTTIHTSCLHILLCGAVVKGAPRGVLPQLSASGATVQKSLQEPREGLVRLAQVDRRCEFT